MRSGTGRGTHPEVWDGSVESGLGLGLVGGPLESSGTCRGTLGEVRDGSKGTSGRSGTGWGTLG